MSASSTLSATVSFTTPIYTADVSLVGTISELSVLEALFSPGTKTSIIQFISSPSEISATVELIIPTYTASVELVGSASLYWLLRRLILIGFEIIAGQSDWLCNVLTVSVDFIPPAYSAVVCLFWDISVLAVSVINTGPSYTAFSNAGKYFLYCKRLSCIST